MREFILGYFDGDGFITYDVRPNARYPCLGFTSGSLNLLIRIADVIEERTGVRPSGPSNREGKGVHVMLTCGKGAPIIDEWLHASGLGLQRKRLS